MMWYVIVPIVVMIFIAVFVVMSDHAKRKGEKIENVKPDEIHEDGVDVEDNLYIKNLSHWVDCHMKRSTKRYLIWLIGSIFGVIMFFVITRPVIGSMLESSGGGPDVGLVVGIFIKGSWATLAAFVAREKGRVWILWAIGSFLFAPCLVIVLLLPHTKQRKDELDSDDHEDQIKRDAYVNNDIANIDRQIGCLLTNSNGKLDEIDESCENVCEDETIIRDIIEVPNKWRVGDGRAPLIIERNPNLKGIFNSKDPPFPQKITDRNREYWQEIAEIGSKRMGLGVAYMLHPDAFIRSATIEICDLLDIVGVEQELIDRLSDSDESVSQAAAISMWKRNKNDYCEFAVCALRDEIRGHTQFGTAGLTLGRENAIRALDILVKEAPDEDSRKAIQKLIDKEVVVEERVKAEDISSVQFVGIDYKDANGGEKYTYEVYKAKNKQQAVVFLKSKIVAKELYYIEVETPDGVFGRDINGIYNI